MLLMDSDKYRVAHTTIFIFASALLLVLLLFAPKITMHFSLSFLFIEAGLLLLASSITVSLCQKVGEGFTEDFTKSFLSPKRNLVPLSLLLLYSISLGCGMYSFIFNPAFSPYAVALFFADIAYLPLYCMFLFLITDRTQYLISLSRDIDDEIKTYDSQKSISSLSKMKSIALDHLARHDYETFGICVSLLLTLTARKKGKSLILLYRCLKEISSASLNDTRACNILLGLLHSSFESVFEKGLLPQTRIVCEFGAFLAVKTEEETNITSSAAAVSFLGKILPSLISAKQTISPKPISILGYLGERALKKGYPTLLGEVLVALSSISVQCIESEAMGLLERTNEAITRIAILSLSKGRKDIAVQVLSHLSRLSIESYRNPRFFSISWNLIDCLGEIGARAASLREESIVGRIASLLKKMGIQSIQGYIRGEKDDLTPARYAIRKLKILKRELENGNMNTIATEVEKAIWDIADAARY